MHISDTAIAGAKLITPSPIEDNRGLFARTYDEAAFAQAGLPTHWPQMNTSWNTQRGTLRGMHYQSALAPEPKLVRCTAGLILDCIVDVRPASPSFKRWLGVELSAANRTALFIPPGVAHGFLTLADACEVLYQMGAVYNAAAAAGVRWNDPAFGITWPFAPIVMSERDATYPDFQG